MTHMPNEIRFEHDGWSLLPEPPDGCECAWANDEGLMIGLQRFGPDTSLRDRLDDIIAVRAHYRAGFANDGMGLIECDAFELDGVNAVRAIGKLILQPPRAVYAGTIALPLPQESYVFNLGAEEVGISGARDSAVWLKASMEFEKQGYVLEPRAEEETDRQQEGPDSPMTWKHLQTGAIKSWAQDPYDADYEGPCLRNLADGAEHDEGFPQHPLSRVRNALQCLSQGVRLSDTLKKRAAGKSGWRFW